MSVIATPPQTPNKSGVHYKRAPPSLSNRFPSEIIHCPTDYAPVSTTQITKTSLFTYSSHSSLTSISSNHTQNMLPVELKMHKTADTRCDSPESEGEGVRLYGLDTAVASPPLAATSPPKTPERKNSDSEEPSGSSVYDSPRRGLRRIRGSISEKYTASVGSDIFLDDETTVANVSLAQTGRRESLTLHHPRPLRSSPKSAYLEEERRKSACGGVSIKLPIELLPQSDPAGDNLVIGDESYEAIVNHENTLLESYEFKPEPKLARSTKIIIETESKLLLSEDDTSDGGVGIKTRVYDKAGRKVTPWPTPRALSFATSVADSQDGDENEEEETGHTYDEPRQFESQRGTPDQPLSGSSGTPSLVDSLNIPTNTHSCSSPQHEASKFSTENTANNPESSVDASSQSKKPVILIYRPPTQPSTPSKPPPPALNLIPATPQALSVSADKEKQLGYSPKLPLLSRRATGFPTSSRPPSLPEDVTPKKEISPARPSIAAVPEMVRESKLHPWWRPQKTRYGSDGEEHEDLDVHYERELKRANTVPLITNKAKRGRQVSIKGTKLVIEFVGWRSLWSRKKKEKAPNKQKEMMDDTGHT